jgi:transposase
MVQLCVKDRFRIVQEWERVGSINKTSKSLNICRKTCERWVKRYVETGGVEDVDGRGRKPVLDEKAAKCALDILVANDHKGPDDVAKTLLSIDDIDVKVVVHRTTLVRAALKASLKEGKKLRAFRGKPKTKLLCQRVVNARLQYCEKMMAKSFSSTVFTDRCKFFFENPGCVVKPVMYGFEGEPRAVSKVNHPKAFNVYAGISKYGVTEMVEVAGTTGRKSPYVNKKNAVSKNITMDEYRDVLAKGLLVDALKIFRNRGQCSFVFLQDNDPTHSVASDVIREFNSKHGSNIILLKPPSNSPDLNPIENVWGWVKVRVDKRGCKTFEEFKAAAREEFRSIPASMLANLVNSMRKRLVACQAAKGQRTRY